jgi:hypothetical protein
MIGVEQSHLHLHVHAGAGIQLLDGPHQVILLLRFGRLPVNLVQLP